MRAAERLAQAVLVLRRDQVPEAQASAEILLARALGISRNAVFLERGRSLSRREDALFSRWIEKRRLRFPIAHIVGAQQFLDFEIASGPQALIPRPETEELAAAAMAALAPRRLEPLQILDLGTGTGCLVLALARYFTRARAIAIDSSQAAVSLARRNARTLGLSRRVRVRRGDFFRPLRGPRGLANLMVSNPPYIPTGGLTRLAPEVRREPLRALDGGKDGLRAIAAVAARAQEALKPSGILALEFGRGQARNVAAILRSRGFERVEILKDAQGLKRIALASRVPRA